MKKTTLLLVLLLAISMVFSSCRLVRNLYEPENANEPENADELWDRIDEVMTDIKSTRADATMKIGFSYLGIKVEAESEMTLVTIGSADSEDCYYYNKSKTKMNMGGTKTNSEEYFVYEDGKAYVYQKSNDDVNGIYSSLASHEFYDYLTDEASDFNISPNGADVKKMSRYDGDIWELSYSSFDKDSVEKIVEQLKLDSLEDSIGIAISDVSVTIKTDKEYRVDKMSVDFLAERYENPVISMDMTFSEYNEAERVDFDKSEYTEVDDIRVVKWLDNYLSEVIDEEKVEFTLYLDQKVTRVGLTHSSYVERDKVIFKNKNGNFTYDISANIGGTEYIIEYANGNQTIFVGDQYQRTPQSEIEAKSFIMSTMNTAQFDPILVNDIERLGDNRYKITITPTDADVSKYRQTLLNLSDNYSSITVYLEVVFDGEDVSLIETHITIKGKLYTVVIESDMIMSYD